MLPLNPGKLYQFTHNTIYPYCGMIVMLTRVEHYICPLGNAVRLYFLFEKREAKLECLVDRCEQYISEYLS